MARQFPNSFRFLLVCHSTIHAVVQDRRRRKNVITGSVQLAHFAPSKEPLGQEQRRMARRNGCAVIFRLKSYRGAL